jgi:hypothetical protein
MTSVSCDIRRKLDEFFVCPLDCLATQALPWGDERFDALVVILKQDRIDDQIRRSLKELVCLNVDWVETLGAEAEALHDEIDEASVAIGRQPAVGEGSPMTAWHEDLREIPEFSEYIRRGGHGSCDFKLVAFVGPEADGVRFVEDLRAALAE